MSSSNDRSAARASRISAWSSAISTLMEVTR
jgi:hypothetical protein